MNPAALNDHLGLFDDADSWAQEKHLRETHHVMMLVRGGDALERHHAYHHRYVLLRTGRSMG